MIDGRSLKVTPFQAANIPPPMALHEITIDSNIIDIASNADSSVIAVLHQEGIAFLDWKSSTAAGSPPMLMGRFTFTTSAKMHESLQQITFSENNSVIVLSSNGHDSLIKRIGFNNDTGRLEEISQPELPATTSILSLSTFFESDLPHPLAQDVTGVIHSLSAAGGSLSHCQFPMALPWIELVLNGDSQIAFGMSGSGHLYANSRLLVKNCTSFLVTRAHLIFTTTAHLIKFVHITNVEGKTSFPILLSLHLLNFQDLEIPPDDPEKDERCRSIERGARLVTAVPTSASVILQMPRGNLETIFPRAMVISGIRTLIEEKNYRRAFTNCRTQRVDMNLLYDHAPEQFLSNVPLFIDQVRKISYIDLFLSSLR